MLSIMSLAFQGVGGNEFAAQKGDSPEERRKQIFRLYVEQMFQRKGTVSLVFPKEKIIGWLSWLARRMREHSQSIFLVEGLQPSWLGTRARLVIFGTAATLSLLIVPTLILTLIFALIFSFTYGLVFGLSFGLKTGWFAGLLGGLEPGSRIALVETTSWDWSQFWRGMIRGSIQGLFSGLILGLILALALGARAIFAARGDLLLATQLILGLPLIFGLPFGLILGLLHGLVGGFTDKVKADKSFPNQGIKLSRKNSLATFFVSSSAAGLLVGLLFGLGGLIIGFSVGLIAGSIVGLNRGGSAVIKHYALRLILWLNGYTPFKFIKFLDQCAKLILLKKVGGGYIFIHRMLLDYFADIPPSMLP